MKCIYLRTNTVNGKQYVGQTNDMKKRDYQWFNTNWFYAGSLITNARNKYGTENFKTEILKECDTQDELNQWEQYYIKELNTKYPNGYNLTDGGDGNSGYQMTDEGKARISAALKGKKKSEEHIRKISESKRGKPNPRSSESKKGKPNPKLRKKVYQYTLDGELVKVWESATETVKYGYNLSKVSDCCRGERKTHNGFIWSFKEGSFKGEAKEKIVYQYTLDGQLVKVWNSTKECGKDGYSPNHVAGCCRGDYGCKTHKGYKWSYQPL